MSLFGLVSARVDALPGPAKEARRASGTGSYAASSIGPCWLRTGSACTPPPPGAIDPFRRALRIYRTVSNTSKGICVLAGMA